MNYSYKTLSGNVAELLNIVSFLALRGGDQTAEFAACC